MGEKIYGLLGRKLGHSWSVPIHQALGCEDYRLIELEPDRLGDFLRREDIGGLNVTIPYKRDVMKFCDVLDPAAEAIGSVNTLVRREGKLVGVQSMKDLRENGYKKISLTAKDAIPEDFFSIPGTANLEWDKSKTSVSFMFSGTVMTIMNQLHRLELEDILIEEPSLEEIFLHYYE